MNVPIKEMIKQKFSGLNKKIVLFIVLGFTGILLIFLSELDIQDSKKDETLKDSTSYSTAEYCNYLESKVTEIVGSIEGAGKSVVMITISETTEYVYAVDQKEIRKNADKTNDLNNENKYVIINKDNDDSGLLLKTIEPKVRGVAVVCEGGDNSRVQEQIYSAVGAVLNISTSRISISKLSVTEEK